MEHRQIFIVTDDSDTHENKTDEEKAQRPRRNEVRTDRRRNRDLENADNHNPKNRRSPIQPRNLDADFVLDYNGQDVFATPSANLAAVFQVLEGLQETPRSSRLALACMWLPRKPSSCARTTRLTAPSRVIIRHNPTATTKRRSTRTTSASSSTNKTCVRA